MKAIVFEEHGSVANLKLTDFPDPEVGTGEVLVRVHAVSLNGFDPMILAKIPGLKTPLPMIPGGDVAGEIAEIGAGIDAGQARVGDRVMIDPLIAKKGGVLGETLRGGACEYVAVPIENLIAIPDNVSYEQAAALPIAYGTAHRMMITRGGVKSGDRVLILGATGGVGTCCLQLAKLMGAEVAVCTSSAEKGARLKEFGADYVIDVSKQDFIKRAHEIWGKPRVFGENIGGADIVVNYSGGDSWAQSLRTVRRDGKLLICGATNGYNPQTDLRFIWSLEINIIGSNAWMRSDLEALLQLVSQRKIDPILYSVRPLAELPASLQDLIDRKVVGKAVLKVAASTSVQ